MMLDMGFIEDVEHIISMSPKERQTMLFSATMPREIYDIARKHMKRCGKAHRRRGRGSYGQHDNPQLFHSKRTLQVCGMLHT